MSPVSQLSYAKPLIRNGGAYYALKSKLRVDLLAITCRCCDRLELKPFVLLFSLTPWCTRSNFGCVRQVSISYPFCCLKWSAWW